MQKNEDKYRTLIEKMEDGLAILKMEFDDEEQPVDWRYLETNPAFLKHTGQEDVEGEMASSVFTNLEDSWLEMYGKVALAGEAVRFENYAAGLESWFEVSAFRIGEPEERKIAVFFKNITERKRARQQRRQVVRKMKAERKSILNIFQQAPSAMCILRGEDHVFERVNDRYMELIGKSREVIGKPVREALPEAEEQGFVELLDQVYQTGESYKGTNMLLRLQRNGDSGNGPEKRYIDFVYQPIREADGSISGIFGQGVDLTELRRVQKELEAMNENLEERVAERTKALLSYQDQLRSLASQLSRAEEDQRQQLASELHDNLGQMLAVSKMKLDLLQKDDFPDQAKTELNELRELLGESLSYTRDLMTDLKPPPSIDEDMRAAIDWVAEKVEKRGLNVIIDDDEHPKPLDEKVRTTVLQSLRELLFNVLKHTEEMEVIIRLRRNEHQLQITVEDEGPGFNVGKVDFAPGKNGGFGLFNIRERIDLLGGRMEIDSEVGQGTKVKLYVPLKESDEIAEEAVSQEEAEKIKQIRQKEGYKRGIKVLLVDDHQMVREGLRKIIEDQEDIRVIGEAADGIEAIRLAREYSPDLILMDVSMPGMDGIEATKRITDEMPDIRIIGLSLHDEEKITEEMRDAGASAYLTKTEAFESLIVTIRAEASA